MWQKKTETKTSAVPEDSTATAVEAKKSTPEIASSAAATPTASSSAPATTSVAEPVVAAAISAEPVRTTSTTASVVEDKAGSRISAGLKIKGEISGTADLVIDGQVEGKVRVASGRLTVGASGRVQADVEAREIVVNGQLIGNLKATDRVQIGSSGSVQGAVTSPRIGIDDGAQLTGKVETGQAAETAPAAKAAVASAGSTAAKKEGE
jgi:cytoskeletal protein CcmA (bactofilin family)